MTAHAVLRPAVVVVLALTPLGFGCARRPALTMASAPAPQGRGRQTTGAGATGPAVRRTASAPSGRIQAGSQAAALPNPKEFTTEPELADIPFDFDRYDLGRDAEQTLDRHAAWLKEHPKDLLLIEGHCDERGTNSYNLALGDRRSTTAKNYLVAQGVAVSRITTISYGEERPLCTEHREACWAKNRRAHFLVKAQ